MEYCTGSAYIDGIVAEPWTLDEDGMLAVPTRPGLGLSIDFDEVLRYTEGRDLFTP